MLGFVVLAPFIMILFIITIGKKISQEILQVRFSLALFLAFLLVLCLSFYSQIAHGNTIFHKITFFSFITFYFSMGVVEFLVLNLCTFLTFCISLRILAFGDDKFYYSNSLVVFMLLTLGSAYGMILSDGLWNILLFYCMTNIAVFRFIKRVSPKPSLWKFYVKKTLLTTILLGGVIVVLIVMFGDITIYDIEKILPQVSPLFLSVFVVVLCFAFLAKVEFFPFNNWISILYQKIDSQNVSFITAVPAKAYFIVFVQIVAIFLHSNPAMSYLLIALGAVSMIFATLKAFFCEHLKRILAFSLMSQIGFMLFCMGFSSSIINEGVLFIFLNSNLALVLMYLSVSYITHNKNTDKLVFLQGYAKEDVISVVLFILGAMSIIGLPPFSGFWGKIFILQGLAEQKFFWAIVLILFAFFLETLLYFKLIRLFFLDMQVDKIDNFLEFWDYVPLLLLAGALLLVSFYPFVIFELLGYVRDNF